MTDEYGVLEMIYNTGETSEELKEKYNPDGSDTRRAQLRMLEMLHFIDDICKKNNIEYYINSGTLLGAVRHGGFIPWDDDLDICISRKDLSRLTKIINSGNFNYIIQNHKTDKGFLRMWSVLRDLKSEYVLDEYEHNLRKYKGVQCDFFIISKGVFGFGRSLVKKMVHFNEMFLLGKHFILSEFLYGMTCLIVNIFRFLSLFNNNKKISYGYESQFPLDWNYKDVFPLSSIIFEDISVPCPRNIDAVLTVNYDENYMDLPDEQNRNHHNVRKIIFYEAPGQLKNS